MSGMYELLSASRSLAEDFFCDCCSCISARSLGFFEDGLKFFQQIQFLLVTFRFSHLL